MEAKDLRIGNYVHGVVREEHMAITGIVFDEDYERYSLDTEYYNDLLTAFTPIPLTEQWLEDFGFRTEKRDGYKFFRVLEGESQWYNLSKCLPNLKSNKDWDFYVMNDEDVWVFRKIQYVHQLQNLFYALSGQELQKVK